MKVAGMKKSSSNRSRKTIPLTLNLPKGVILYTDDIDSDIISHMPINNRKPKTANIKARKKQILHSGQDSPIILYLDEKDQMFYILDGGHRFEAIKELTSFMMFYIDPYIKSLSEAKNYVERINNLIDPHTLDDVVSRNSGEDDYDKYYEMHRRVHNVISHHQLIYILCF